MNRRDAIAAMAAPLVAPLLPRPVETFDLSPFVREFSFAAEPLDDDLFVTGIRRTGTLTFEANFAPIDVLGEGRYR